MLTNKDLTNILHTCNGYTRNVSDPGGLEIEHRYQYTTQRCAVSLTQLNMLLGAVSWPSVGLNGQANCVLGRPVGLSGLLHHITAVVQLMKPEAVCIRATWHFGGRRHVRCSDMCV